MEVICLLTEGSDNFDPVPTLEDDLRSAVGRTPTTCTHFPGVSGLTRTGRGCTSSPYVSVSAGLVMAGVRGEDRVDGARSVPWVRGAFPSDLSTNNEGVFVRVGEEWVGLHRQTVSVGSRQRGLRG